MSIRQCFSSIACSVDPGYACIIFTYSHTYVSKYNNVSLRRAGNLTYDFADWNLRKYKILLSLNDQKTSFVLGRTDGRTDPHPSGYKSVSIKRSKKLLLLLLPLLVETSLADFTRR